MRYLAPLIPGRLLRRYKRFLADVELGTGETVTAHVPNSGRMTGCSAPGSPCLLAPASGPKRRLPYTLEQVVAAGVAVGVNTLRANALAEEALRAGVVRPRALAGEWRLDREVRRGRSRIDFRLTDRRGELWLEVKNITLVEGGTALFPDAVTARGARHMDELASVARDGGRAALLYVVQRGDADRVAVDDALDPAYGAAFGRARAAGVDVLAVQVLPGPTGLQPWRELPVAAR